MRPGTTASTGECYSYQSRKLYLAINPSRPAISNNNLNALVKPPVLPVTSMEELAVCLVNVLTGRPIVQTNRKQGGLDFLQVFKVDRVQDREVGVGLVPVVAVSRGENADAWFGGGAQVTPANGKQRLLELL